MRRALPWICALSVLVVDRLTKLAVLRSIDQGSLIPVFPGLALSHVHNPGIAFSLFSSGGPLTRVLLHLVIVGAVVLVAWMIVRHGLGGPLAAVSLGLILGGALGNLVDRVLYGWVVDFIHVWVRLGDRVLSWPDFNVADSAITVGAGLLILYELRGAGRSGDHAPDSD
jgi:signal peptidase II